jgi:hypothetical protein
MVQHLFGPACLLLFTRTYLLTYFTQSAIVYRE